MVYIPQDFYAANPAVSPFSTSPPPTYAPRIPEGTRIGAIFVFEDPFCDWALSIQVIIDVLLSDNGRLGARRNPEDLGPHVPLYFANPDLLWTNTYSYPRLGKGAFQHALHGAYIGIKIDGCKKPDYRPLFFGKPGQAAFRVAEFMVLSNFRGWNLGHNRLDGADGRRRMTTRWRGLLRAERVNW